MELKRTYVYIGKTQNLRRRLSEHTHLTETHPFLADYLRRHRHSAKIWYTVDIDSKAVDGLEKKLIRELKPEFNRLKYVGGTESE